MTRTDIRVRISPTEQEAVAVVLAESGPELLADVTEGRATVYTVVVERRYQPGEWLHLGGNRWVVLDRSDWAGEYSLDELDAKSPGPDANWLNDLVESTIAGIN